MSKRRRIKQAITPRDRLISRAKELRDEAEQLPPGTERDDMLRRAGRADTAAQLVEWVDSPGLQPPKSNFEAL